MSKEVKDRIYKIQVADRIDKLAEIHAWLFVNNFKEEAEQVAAIARRLAKEL